MFKVGDRVAWYQHDHGCETSNVKCQACDPEGYEVMGFDYVDRLNLKVQGKLSPGYQTSQFVLIVPGKSTHLPEFLW